MTEQEFWFKKILQLFHDPPGKPFAFWPGTGGHMKLAQDIFTAILKKKYWINPVPDIVATGADRPLLTIPKGQKGGIGTRHFHKDPTVTHPLGNAPIRLRLPFGVEKVERDTIDELALLQQDTAEQFAPDDIGSAEELKHTFFRLWRRFREEVLRKDPGSLWEFMPADSRCPDHSIWEHNRVASALSFVKKELAALDQKDPAYPWLLSFGLRPVQEFLKQARKGQDLWTGSMLIAELSWAAIEKVITHYGPDCIVYPDLRGNPRADIWLYSNVKSAFPGSDSTVSTRAAVIPHTFIAILPRGSDKSNHLWPIERLAENACKAVKKRWQDLADDVEKWMEGTTSRAFSPAWNKLWEYGKDNCPLEPTWVAIPWPVIEGQNQYYFPGGALPAQDQEQIKRPDEHDARVIKKREGLLGKWMPGYVWKQYEYELSVFARTNEKLLLYSGYAYAPSHHKLKTIHDLRKRMITLPEPSPPEVSYEKCTICRIRGAISDYKVKTGDKSEDIRKGIREFWKSRELDPEEKGSERLCPVCSAKRFLVRSGSQEFNQVWVGAGHSIDDERDHDGKLRTPFPSTVVIAAQEYLEGLAEHYDGFSIFLDSIVKLHGQLDIQRSSFTRTLPRLAAAVKKELRAKDFLMLDPQLALFPEMVESQIQSKAGDDPGKREIWKELLKQIQELRKRADKKFNGPPKTQVAILVMDGDRMGKLLLGDPQKIKARWQDVIHPDIVEKIRNSEYFRHTGWPELLRLRRMGGPSLQAFISRALADFAHHIVPWVVEQEFSGRLIYAGGDDLLALAPAHEALKIAARLQELFSAYWIVDRQPDTRPWSWLDKDADIPWGSDRDKARERFQVLDSEEYKDMEGRLLPMLGGGNSLSAGIMCGHFKTRMGLLLEGARTMLGVFAKEKAGRGAAGLGHFSRSGPKTRFAAKWRLSNDIKLDEAVEKIIEAFKKDKIPSSLPYKLARYTQYLDPVALDLDGGDIHKVMNGLLSKALDGEKIDEGLREAILSIWMAGYSLSMQKDGFCRIPEEIEFSPMDGLFLCRYLAGCMEES